MTLVVDDFESQSLANYTGKTSDYTFSSTTIKEGSYSLKYTGNNWKEIVSLSGLANYPAPGDTFRIYMHPGDDRVAQLFCWAVQSGSWVNDCYAVRIDGKKDRFSIEKATGGSFSILADDGNVTELSSSPAQWFEVEVTWTSGGSITAVLYDGTGTQLTSVSTTDTAYSSGGIAFEAKDRDDVFNLYWDGFTIDGAVVVAESASARNHTLRAAASDAAIADDAGSLTAGTAQAVTGTGSASDTGSLGAAGFVSGSSTATASDSGALIGSSTVDSAVTHASATDRLGVSTPGLLVISELSTTETASSSDGPNRSEAKAGLASTETATGSDFGPYVATSALNTIATGAASNTGALSVAGLPQASSVSTASDSTSVGSATSLGTTSAATTDVNATAVVSGTTGAADAGMASVVAQARNRFIALSADENALTGSSILAVLSAVAAVEANGLGSATDSDRITATATTDTLDVASTVEEAERIKATASAVAAELAGAVDAPSLAVAAATTATALGSAVDDGPRTAAHVALDALDAASVGGSLVAALTIAGTLGAAGSAAVADTANARNHKWSTDAETFATGVEAALLAISSDVTAGADTTSSDVAERIMAFLSSTSDDEATATETANLSAGSGSITVHDVLTGLLAILSVRVSLSATEVGSADGVAARRIRGLTLGTTDTAGVTDAAPATFGAATAGVETPIGIDMATLGGISSGVGTERAASTDGLRATLVEGVSMSGVDRGLAGESPSLLATTTFTLSELAGIIESAGVGLPHIGTPEVWDRSTAIVSAVSPVTPGVRSVSDTPRGIETATIGGSATTSSFTAQNAALIAWLRVASALSVVDTASATEATHIGTRSDSAAIDDALTVLEAVLSVPSTGRARGVGVSGLDAAGSFGGSIGSVDRARSRLFSALGVTADRDAAEAAIARARSTVSGSASTNTDESGSAADAAGTRVVSESATASVSSVSATAAGGGSATTAGSSVARGVDTASHLQPTSFRTLSWAFSGPVYRATLDGEVREYRLVAAVDDYRLGGGVREFLVDADVADMLVFGDVRHYTISGSANDED
jgi:hypothetical protein